MFDSRTTEPLAFLYRGSCPAQSGKIPGRNASDKTTISAVEDGAELETNRANSEEKK